MSFSRYNQLFKVNRYFSVFFDTFSPLSLMLITQSISCCPCLKALGAQSPKMSFKSVSVCFVFKISDLEAKNRRFTQTR